MSRAYGFLLEFTPMKIGAGMTFLEVAYIITRSIILFAFLNGFFSTPVFPLV